MTESKIGSVLIDLQPWASGTNEKPITITLILFVMLDLSPKHMESGTARWSIRTSVLSQIRTV